MQRVRPDRAGEPARRARARRPGAGGTGLAVLAAGLLSVAGAALPRLATRDDELARLTLEIDRAESEVRAMVRELELELEGARAFRPRASLLRPLEAAETGRLVVSSTQGFPDAGLLLLSPGSAAEERVRYARTAPAAGGFVLLSRGRQCTAPALHPSGAEVWWAGLAEPLARQDPPPQGGFDGVALEPGGALFFRGAGAGFSYHDAAWPPERPDGAAVLYFEPDLELSEREARRDLNGDGDLADRFDVGQLRRRAWGPADRGAPPRDVGLGPRSLLQERCAWGGDLDADGFDDPLFLADAEAGWLHLRLFVLGRSDSGALVVRRIESRVGLGSPAGG